VLEIGSSTGAFLEEIRKRAPGVKNAAGVEPDDKQRAFARSLGLQCVQAIEEAPRGPYDLIVLFHVLEHLPRPVDMLSRLAGMLAPDGAVVAEVPNVEDALLSRYAIPEFEKFYWHPAHTLYFSRETLARTGEAADLRVSVEPVQRYSLANHLHWALERQPAGSSVVFDHLSARTERAYAEDLCRHFICDTLWMVGRR
jgi:SAM-dependent methyltransferase